MRLSQHFGRTLWEAPGDSHLTSYRLMMRAGLARQMPPGAWSYLPLGWRVMRRLKAILRESLDILTAEEIDIPSTVHPGPTTVEAVTELCTSEIESYKDLPRTLYRFGRRVDDAGKGLFQLHESHIFEAISLHADRENFDHSYTEVQRACLKAFARCGLEPILTGAAVDVPGEGDSHAYVLPHPDGMGRIVRCESCGYVATQDVAVFERGGNVLGGEQLPPQKVATPNCKTIADLCSFLNLPPQQTLKLVIYATPTGQIVMALVRGDLGVNQVKLIKLIGVDQLEVATEEQIEAIGAVAGYASPIGLKVARVGDLDGVWVVADESLRTMSNFVTGANEAGYHIANVNYPRDFEVTQIGDIAAPFEGSTCAHCGGILHLEPAVELGYSAKLGVRFSQPAGAAYLDAQGQRQPIMMGYYVIDLGQMMAAIIEAHHDAHGIIWPRDVAPFDLHLIALARDEAIAEIAHRLYRDLRAAGIEILFDDRNLSPGVMFADADLIGLPLRVTVSKRSLESGGVEIKQRGQEGSEVLALDGAVSEIVQRLQKGRAG